VIRYLIDTNVISEIHKPKPHGAWLRGSKACGRADLSSAVTLVNCRKALTHTANKTQVKPGRSKHGSTTLENI